METSNILKPCSTSGAVLASTIAERHLLQGRAGLVQEIRVDIDPAVKPDIVASITSAIRN